MAGRCACCGGVISPRANPCPHCGDPNPRMEWDAANYEREQEDRERRAKSRRQTLTFGPIILLVSLGVMAFVGSQFNGGGQPSGGEALFGIAAGFVAAGSALSVLGALFSGD